MSAQLYLCDGCFIPAVVGGKTISVWNVGGPLYDKTVPSWLRKRSPSKPFQLKLPARRRQNRIRPDTHFSWMEDFVWPERLWSERINCQLIEVIYSKFNFRVKQFVFLFLCCMWMCWHVSACTRFSYQRRGPERPYPERPAAGPAGPCPCSLWSRHGKMSRSTACACWLRKEEGQERKRHLHHLSSCSNLKVAAVASELRLCEREDDGTKRGNSSAASMSCLCLWWMCWLFLSLLQLAGQLMEVLGWQKNDFHLTSQGLFAVEKFLCKTSPRATDDKTPSKGEILNISNPICCLSTPSAFTDITKTNMCLISWRKLQMDGEEGGRGAAATLTYLLHLTTWRAWRNEFRNPQIPD